MKVGDKVNQFVKGERYYLQDIPWFTMNSSGVYRFPGAQGTIPAENRPLVWTEVNYLLVEVCQWKREKFTEFDYRWEKVPKVIAFFNSKIHCGDEIFITGEF